MMPHCSGLSRAERPQQIPKGKAKDRTEMGSADTVRDQENDRFNGNDGFSSQLCFFAILGAWASRICLEEPVRLNHSELAKGCARGVVGI
jgi:hypothetical protein